MSSKVFTLEGKSLKLDTAADIEPHLKDLVASNDVEEARFQGNTLGVEACEALAKVLETKKTLQVCCTTLFVSQGPASPQTLISTSLSRTSTSPTSSLVVYFPRSLPL